MIWQLQVDIDWRIQLDDLQIYSQLEKFLVI